jgi:hypothetical protein
VVGYDKQEQRSLATALHNQLFGYRRSFIEIFAAVREAITSRSGAIPLIVGGGVTALLILFLVRRIRRFGWRRGLSLARRQANGDASSVLFYERLLALLARRGVKREPDLTPLEFASGLDLKPALAITQAYNRVRFGRQQLSPAELKDIERALEQLEAVSSK